MQGPLPLLLKPEDWILYVLNHTGPSDVENIRIACNMLNERNPSIPPFTAEDDYTYAIRQFSEMGFIEVAEGSDQYQMTQRGRLYLLSFFCAPPDPQTR
ncbi:MAG TPA: hypothetical protein VKK79_14200 [Candidatus Lokiarchaeia archaeon]|nr:hypothetical protein [Candidatus Lokiarchaeia archaeon]